MARRIVWSNPSLQDLGELHEYIAQGSSQHAKNFLQNLRKTAENLIDFPQLGRMVPEFEDASIRELLMIKELLSPQESTRRPPHAPKGPTNPPSNPR